MMTECCGLCSDEMSINSAYEHPSIEGFFICKTCLIIEKNKAMQNEQNKHHQQNLSP